MRKAQEWNHPCPNMQCEYYGQMNSGNIVSVSTHKSKSVKGRVFSCKHCGEMFSETQDAVFFYVKTLEDKAMMALKMILVQVSLASIYFALRVKEETVLE